MNKNKNSQIIYSSVFTHSAIAKYGKK